MATRCNASEANKLARGQYTAGFRSSYGSAAADAADEESLTRNWCVPGPDDLY
jgi:hypothetical protein